MKLELMLRGAGWLHFALLAAGASMSQVTGLGEHSGKLPPFLRQLFRVYFGYMAYIVASFGVLTLLNAADLARGGPLARNLCLFIGIFWAARLLIQFTVFDPREYITNGRLRLGYHATTAAFVCLTGVYALAAWRA